MSTDTPKDSSTTQTLKYPFEWDDAGEKKLVREVIYVRPKGKHLKHIGAAPTMKDLVYIATKISGKTPAFFEEMDAADYIAMTEVIADFLDGGRETGETA